MNTPLSPHTLHKTLPLMRIRVVPEGFASLTTSIRRLLPVEWLVRLLRTGACQVSHSTPCLTAILDVTKQRYLDIQPRAPRTILGRRATVRKGIRNSHHSLILIHTHTRGILNDLNHGGIAFIQALYLVGRLCRSCLAGSATQTHGSRHHALLVLVLGRVTTRLLVVILLICTITSTMSCCLPCLIIHRTENDES